LRNEESSGLLKREKDEVGNGKEVRLKYEWEWEVKMGEE
jgi:hypothetical protein